MSASDVNALIDYEKTLGSSVGSWQVRGLWDANKRRVQTDEQAKILSTAMRALEDYYLRVLHALNDAGKAYFLVSLLSPYLAYFDVEFVNLDPSTLKFDGILRTENVGSGRRSLAARTVRIAFEELETYVSKSVVMRKIDKRFVDSFMLTMQDIMKFAKSLEPSALAKQWDDTVHSAGTSEEKEARIADLLELKSDDDLAKHAQVLKGIQDIFDSIGHATILF
jgi:hypothetical protein